MTEQEASKLANDMEKEADEIIFSAQRLSWYMRGGISFNDLLNMSTYQLNNINEIVKENMETTKKSGLPFF